MILATGIDITDIRRIEKALKDKRFATRVFTEGEQKKAASRKKAGAKIVAATYAKRFAAKEACMKALGARDISWQDMEVINGKNGAPTLKLTGGGAKALKAITPKGKKARMHLALTDEYPYAIAQVIIATYD